MSGPRQHLQEHEWQICPCLHTIDAFTLCFAKQAVRTLKFINSRRTANLISLTNDEKFTDITQILFAINMYVKDVYDILNGRNTIRREQILVLTPVAKLANNELTKNISVIIDRGCNLNILRPDLVEGMILNTIKLPNLMSANAY